MPPDTMPAAADDDWEPALRARMIQAGLDKYLDGPATGPRIFPRESDLEFEARRQSLEAEQQRALWLLVACIPDHVKARMQTMGWTVMMRDPFEAYTYARRVPYVQQHDDDGGGAGAGGASNGNGTTAGSPSAVARPPSTASDRLDRPPAAILAPKQQAPVAAPFSRSPLAVRPPSPYHNQQHEQLQRQPPTTTASFIRRSSAPSAPPAEPPPAPMRGQTPAHPDTPAPAGPPAKRPFLGRPKGWKPGMSYRQFRDDPEFAAAAAAAADVRSRSTAKARPKNGTQPRKAQRLANSVTRAKRPAVEPVWYPYLCRWGPCMAELHNAETLSRHLRIVHCQPLIRAGRKLLHCDWKNCVRSAACQTPEELLGHVMRRHVQTMVARLGEGTRNTITPRGSLGVAGEGEPLPDYLFYRDGTQVTPSLRNQPLEDAAAARERKKRLEATLRAAEPESESEDEDEDEDEDEGGDNDKKGDSDEHDDGFTSLT